MLASATVAAPAPAHGVEEAVAAQLELLQQPVASEEIGIANLAPRKPDWDLKRDVAKKLERLEHRTQRAIAELIRERLRAANEAGGPPTAMLEAVNLGAAAAEHRSKVVSTRATAEAADED